MPTSFEEFWPEDVVLRSKVKDVLAKEFDEPEGGVRARWVLKLIQEYSFHSEQIDINVPAGAGREAERTVVTADIVAYRDRARHEPFIVVETKRAKEKAGVKQAESYSRNLGADFHVWGAGAVTKYFRTARYIDRSAEVGNIPRWVGDEPVAERLPKTLLLPPFRNEPHLREVVKLCHDQIFFGIGHDPAKAFDELMKLLFVKLFDERETPRYYEFMTLAGETSVATANRIRQLFGKSISSRRYKDVFTTRFSDISALNLELDDETICFIVKQFQGYSLVDTTATLEGVDVKGTVFERMVGSTFRGELGAYFTPREIVEFMVQIVDPTRDDLILDPSCGSGGFLIMVIKYVLQRARESLPNLDDAEILGTIKQFAETNLFGVDINDRMARVSKMNMIMHGDGHSGIFHDHGLSIGYSTNIPIKLGTVNKIFSNPPFAGREKDPKLLANFTTAKSESGKIVSLHKSLPFVELIIQLLAQDGVAALVLPNGIFNSQAYHFRKLRELIWEKCEVIAAIGLPHWVFFHTGCDVQGALLFIRRTDKPRADYNVFIDWAENVGYDAAGRKTDKSDFNDILARFRKPPKANLFKVSALKKAGRIDPQYYQPGEHADRLRAAQKSGTTVPLTTLLVPSTEFVKKSKRNQTHVRYFEVGDTDPANGEIVKATDYEIAKLPSRAKYVVHENNLLIPNHRNSIKAMRSVVLVPREHDGAICTSRFIVCRTTIPTLYLYHILNLDFIKKEMLRLVSGSSSTEVKFEQLKEIHIPIPKDGDFDLLVDEVESLAAEIADLNARLNEKRTALRSKFVDLYGGHGPA